MNIKLIRRSGNNRIYATDKGNIEVVLCLDPNLYVNPGYYLRCDSRFSNNLLSKRFSNGMKAIKAAYNSLA